MLRATPGRNATRFDLETLTAILAFVNARVTWAVVECGLGGRVDSTNVIDGEVFVLTNVGLEHTAVLGTTHAAIAFQKVGILKRGATMITGVVPDCAAGQVIGAQDGEPEVDLRAGRWRGRHGRSPTVAPIDEPGRKSTFVSRPPDTGFAADISECFSTHGGGELGCVVSKRRKL